MSEKAGESPPINKPQAWWVQRCLRTRDFSIVENSSLSPKRKLYVAHSIIINLAIKLGLLEMALEKKDLNIALIYSVAFMQQNSKNNPFIQAVLKFAGENIYEGVYEEGAFGTSSPEADLAMGISTGGGSLTMHLEKIAEKYQISCAEVLTTISLEAFKKLAETPINEVHSYELTERCQKSRKAEFKLTEKGLALIAKEKALDKRISPLHRGFKPPSHPAIQENVRCPLLDAGVFPDAVRLAAIRASQSAQPDD